METKQQDAFAAYARLRAQSNREQMRWFRLQVSRRAKIIALVASLLTAAGVFVSLYQPIVPGNGSHIGLCFEEIGEFYRPSGFSTKIIRSKCWADGSDVTWGMSVRKAGLIPVTVTGVEPPDASFLTSERVRMHPAQGWDEGDLPFAPFRLAHDHDERFIILAGTYDGCDDPKGSDSWTKVHYDEIVVHYSILGFDRTARVPLRFQAQLPCWN